MEKRPMGCGLGGSLQEVPQGWFAGAAGLGCHGVMTVM